jgi:hypothetical protein
MERLSYHQFVRIARAQARARALVLIPFHSTLPLGLYNKLWCSGMGQPTKEISLHVLTQIEWMSFFTIPSSSTCGIDEEQFSRAHTESDQIRRTTCWKKTYVSTISFPSPNSLVISKYSTKHHRITTFVLINSTFTS